MHETNTTRISSSLLAKRFGVCQRTIDRWLSCAALRLPQPIVINRRRYWLESEIEEWEIARREAQQLAAA